MARFAVGVSLAQSSFVRNPFKLSCSRSFARFAIHLIALMVVISSQRVARAQNFGVQLFSTNAFGVDLASTGVNISIPMRSKIGKIPYAGAFNGTSLYFPAHLKQGGYQWKISNAWTTQGWMSYSDDLTVGIASTIENFCGTSPPYDYIHDTASITDRTGASHPLPPGFTWTSGNSSTCHATSGSAMTTDGSGFTIVITSGVPTVYDRSGNLYTFGSGILGNLGILNSAVSIADPDSATVSINPTTGVVSDTLGTSVVTLGYTSTRQVNCISYVASDAQTDCGVAGDASYLVTYPSSPQTIATDFECTSSPDGNIPEATGTMSLPTSITTPTGATYTFTYESTPNNLAATTGRIASITYPSGGSISYTYSDSNNHNGMNCNSFVVPETTIKVDDHNGNVSIWTYDNTNNSNGNIPSDFIVIETGPADPSNNNVKNQTVHYFAGEYQTETLEYQGGCPTTINSTYCNGRGTLLRTTETCYNGNFNSKTFNCVAPSPVPTLPIKQTDVYIALGSSSSSLVETIYDCKTLTTCYGLVTEVKTYNGQTAGTAPTGSPVMDRKIFYGTANSSDDCQSLTNANIHDKVCADQYFPNGGSTIDKLTYIFRDPNTGDATQIKKWVSGTSNTFYLNTYLTYGGSGAAPGVVSSIKDPDGATTSFSSFTCGGVLPQTITYPLLPSASQTWDCNAGVLLSSTDVNGNKTTYTYGDPLDRLTEIDYPNSLGYHKISYGTGTSTPWTVTTTDDLDGTNSVSTTTTVDGFGRTVNYLDTSSATTATAYNVLGQVSSVSNPYFSGGTVDLSTYAYDALGRVTLITNPDTSSRQTLYTGRAWQITDESSIQRIYQSDDLGRLIDVCDGIGTTGTQPDGSSAQSCGLSISGSGFLTTYGYDALNRITSASVAGQGRSYNYDGLDRMTSESNPESGSVTYNYDAQNAGDLSSRVRPAANGNSGNTTTTYTHDTLHRLTGISYSDGTFPVTLQYDQSSIYGLTLTNGKGRLTNAAAANGYSSVTSSYDLLGRLQDQWQCTPLNCGSGTTHLNYGYNHLGEMSSYLDGQMGVTYTYTYDGNARLSQIQSSLNNPPYYPSPLFTVASGGYNALGEIVSATLGNGIPRAATYDKRGRPTNVADGTIYSYNLTYTGNDITEADDLNGNWTYGYDFFDRLSTSCSHDAQHICGTNPLLSFTYLYDPKGNRWNQNGGPPNSSYTFDTNNHITNSGVVYDAEGNVTNDGLGNTYVYDAENRPISADGGSITYTYDGLGRRVEQSVNGAQSDYVYGPSGVADLWTSAGVQWSQLAGSISLGLYANSSTYFYHQDWLGTMRAISTNAGNQEAKCTSLAFGDSLVCTSFIPYPGSDLHFTGQEWDSQVSLTHFPMRNYSMTQGRWMHADPAGIAAVVLTNPQSWNRYGYVTDSPVNYIDPLGLVKPGCGGPEQQPCPTPPQQYGGSGSGGDPNPTSPTSQPPPRLPGGHRGPNRACLLLGIGCPKPKTSDCLGAGAPPPNSTQYPPSDDPTAPAGLVPTPNSPIPVQGPLKDGSGYASGNLFIYQLVDGTGAAMNESGISITEDVARVDQDGNQTSFTSSQNTGSEPGTGPGQIEDFVGTTTPWGLPNYTDFYSMTTSQNMFATWQGQNIGLDPAYNQQIVTYAGYTLSCVTPISK